MNDATALADQVRAGEIDAVTTVEDAIARCEQVNPTINAIVEQTYESARERAAESSARGPSDGLLAGVPIALKDLFCPAEGEPGYQGNRRLAELDYRYSETGAVARRWAESRRDQHRPLAQSRTRRRAVPRSGGDRAVWTLSQPVEHRPHGAGLERWRSCSGGGRHRAHRACQRRGRFHPDPGKRERARRSQALAGSDLGRAVGRGLGRRHHRRRCSSHRA